MTGRFAVVVAVVMAAVLTLAALAPGLFTGADPTSTDPAGAVLGPSADHLLGTDALGRDVFSRLVHGTRTSLAIGAVATLTALAGGVLLGLSMVLAPRRVAAVVHWLVDVLLAFPGVLLALLVVAVVGRGTADVALAIAIGAMPGYARLVRTETLRVRRSEFIEGAVLLGLPRRRIVLRHLVPNVVGPVVVLATIGLGETILAGAALSYLGLGPTGAAAEWGAMLAEGRDYLGDAWWIAVLPGAAITLTVVSVTVLGRALQRRTGSGPA